MPTLNADRTAIFRPRTQRRPVTRMARLLIAAAITGSLAGLALTPASAQSATQPDTAPAPAQSNGAGVSDTVLNKAGVALRQVTQIKQDYSRQIQATTDVDRQQVLAHQAQDASVQAVQSQGLSVDQYNQVLHLAQADPGVRARLLGTAQAR